MEESPGIADIPRPCRIWAEIHASSGRRVQWSARTSFGRSNRSSAAEFSYQQPLKICARSDGSNSRKRPRSASIFESVFSAKTNPTRVHLFFMDGLSDVLFEGNFFVGYCVLFTNMYLQILSLFRSALHCRTGVKPDRPHWSTEADLRQARRRFNHVASSPQ